ncbi:MAG: tetratricopeptide repeat protein [Gemmatimonadota bacterium]|jgi:tetratricopeptide (TPR) repeat protein|nr:tetratricopeptide repeat protein [Gemmatimonadota bacterium]
MSAAGVSPVLPDLPERDRKILLGFVSRIEPGDAGGHNNLGVLYFDKGLIEEAVDQFQRALEIDPTMAVAIRNVEIAYLATGLYDRLTAELGERLQMDPEDQESRWRLARAHRFTGRLDEARAELRRMLNSAPDDPRLLVELGRADKAAGAWTEALALYERALRVDPGSAVLHFHIGELHYQQGQNEEARRVLLRAIESAPEFAEAHHLLSFVAGDLGDVEAAELSLGRARELAPWLAETRPGLSIDRHSKVRYTELVGDRASRPEALKDRFLAHYHIGIACRQKGLYEEALQSFGRALERGEDARLVTQARAEVLLVAGRDAEAAELYRSLIGEYGANAKLLNELGVCLHRLGELARAEGRYEEALGIDPGYSFARNNLGVAHANRGDRTGARILLNEAVAGAGAPPEAFCNLGILAMEESRRREALSSFRDAVQADPHSAPGWLGIGAVLSESDEPREARRALARAIELTPDSAEARYRMGFLLNRMGDLEGSLRETRRALALNPYFTASRLRLVIELQFEYAEVLAPELSVEVRLDEVDTLRGFTVSTGEIAEIFAGLKRGTDTQSEAPAPDFTLARDHLSKGLVGRALAEVKRVARAGGDPVEAALLSGEIFRIQGLHGEALDQFDSAVELLREARWSERSEQAHLGRGWSLLSLNRAEQALGEAAIVRDAGGDRFESGRLEAEAQLIMGDAQAAIQGLSGLLEMRPGDPAVLSRIGSAARAAGRSELARRVLIDALRADPDRIAARIELGRLCLADGLVSDAIEHGRAALEALPGYMEAALLVAEGELERGDPDAAISVLADLLYDDPYNLDILLRLGELLRIGERHPDDVIFAFRRVVRFDPTHAVAWMRLGETLLAAGRENEAVACWRRAVDEGLPVERARAVSEAIRKHHESVGSERAP